MAATRHVRAGEHLEQGHLVGDLLPQVRIQVQGRLHGSILPRSRAPVIGPVMALVIGTPPCTLQLPHASPPRRPYTGTPRSTQRKSIAKGKSVSVSVEVGGCRNIKKNTQSK